MKTKPTLLMRQSARIKGQHRVALLFFRMGDFYETLRDNEVTAATKP